MPYINGRIVNTLNDDFYKYLPYCTKDVYGQPYLEFYGPDKGRLTPMCPYTEFWQDKVAELVERIGKELGANAVYIDQLAASIPKLCFDKSHGHPLGGGSWWVDGYRKMLEKVRKVAHSDGRDIIITSEMAAEHYIDLVDAFLICVKRDGKSIPMSPAVYSGYSIYFGSPAPLEYSDRAWIMVQGRDFLWGCQNGWMGFEILLPEHSKKAAFLRKIGQYRIAAKKFITYGELVDTIAHHQVVTEYWSDRNGNPYSVTLPVIQGSVWKGPNGSLSILLVNYLEREESIDLEIDLESYGLKTRTNAYQVSQIHPDNTQVKSVINEAVFRYTEVMGPWEICVLEINMY
ncbi:MAG: hypothetical protein JXB29_13155 [Sedimentisphaerales bacterium]|nr:hypothetical protein [Sedimentisphaerales bacterium]